MVSGTALPPKNHAFCPRRRWAGQDDRIQRFILASDRTFWNRHMPRLHRSWMSSSPLWLAALSAFCLAGAGVGGPARVVAQVAPLRDTRYPGVIRIAVDASDTAQGIFRVHEVIPVRGGGGLTLLYPQ